MTRWSVLVRGDETSLHELPSLLPEPQYRCADEPGLCVLTSPTFDAIPNTGDLSAHVTGLLSSLVAVMRTFSNPYARLEFAGTRSKTPDGRNHATSGPVRIVVLDPAALDPLRLPHAADGTHAMALVSLANRDPAVALAYRIVSASEFGWREVYDIVELLGDREFLDAGRMTKSVLRDLKQTANHHRHLGEPAKNPLPPNPPSFWDAYQLVSAVLREWLDRRLNVASTSGSAAP